MNKITPSVRLSRFNRNKAYGDTWEEFVHDYLLTHTTSVFHVDDVCEVYRTSPNGHRLPDFFLVNQNGHRLILIDAKIKKGKYYDDKSTVLANPYFTIETKYCDDYIAVGKMFKDLFPEIEFIEIFLFVFFDEAEKAFVIDVERDSDAYRIEHYNNQHGNNTARKYYFNQLTSDVNLTLGFQERRKELKIEKRGYIPLM